jgi:hypothetical protein
MLQRLILAADDRIVRRLDPISSGWDVHFSVTQ